MLRALLMLVLLGLGTGCRSSERIVELSPSAVVLDVPVLLQAQAHECGFIAVEILCRYHGLPLAPAQAAQLRATALRENGLNGAEIRAALEASGYEAYVVAGTLDRAPTGAYEHLDRGRPLIAMSGSEDGHRHYEVLIGYDEPRDNLILLDPVRGRVARARTVFERGWARCERFLLLALPRSEAPGTLHSP
jgi:ABC-type bacteriocin/lantibiotic exporter with double-glycine peptidase domain